jgi:hypothetical protein
MSTVVSTWVAASPGNVSVATTSRSSIARVGASSVRPWPGSTPTSACRPPFDAAAPPLIWTFVTAAYLELRHRPTRYLHFMNGIARWEVTTEQDRGLGARDLAWTSVTGIDQHGRWRLRERAGGE